jgi:hypothetical protein
MFIFILWNNFYIFNVFISTCIYKVLYKIRKTFLNILIEFVSKLFLNQPNLTLTRVLLDLFEGNLIEMLFYLYTSKLKSNTSTCYSCSEIYSRLDDPRKWFHEWIASKKISSDYSSEKRSLMLNSNAVQRTRK